MARYARASAVRVSLTRHDGWVRVEVTDDGVGGADASRGTGLRGLKDRVSAVRGRFLVQPAPGGGTRVLAQIPDELRAVVVRERPDAVITDIRMPPDHTSEGLVAAQ